MKKIQIWRSTKFLFLKLARDRSSINQIAFGSAIGTFISVFPTFGFGTVLVLLLYRFLKFNIVSALGMSLISNPFTSPFFMLLSFKMGSIVLRTNIEFNINNWRENIVDTGFVILLGSLIVSSILAILAFYISRTIIIRIRKRNESTFAKDNR